MNSINLFENEWFNKINIPQNTNSLIYFVLSRLQSDFFDLQIVLEQLSGQSRVEKLIKLLNKETRANQLRFVDEFIGNKSILNWNLFREYFSKEKFMTLNGKAAVLTKPFKFELREFPVPEVEYGGILI